MRHSRLFRLLVVGGIAAGCLGVTIRRSRAAEETPRFLEALRQEGLFDMALAYLDEMRTSPLCPPEFKDLIDYEAGITLILGSRSVPATTLRDLDEARRRFEKFLAEHPEHVLAPGATTQLANVLKERGRLKMYQASKPSKSAAEQKNLKAEARTLLGEARKIFAASEKRFHEAEKKFPAFIEHKKVKEREARDQVRKNLGESRVLLAAVLYDIAMTYEPGSKQRTDQLMVAAKNYNALYEGYKSRLAGPLARLGEARCYKELGDSKKAIEILDELAMQPDEPQAFRDLKNRSLILTLETYMLPNVKNYRQAVARAQTWMNEARSPEESSPEGLAVKYLAAEASLELARSLDKNNPRRKENLTNARKLFGFVTRFPGDHQRSARAKLMDPLLQGGGGASLRAPRDFVEARDRAQTAQDRMLAAQNLAQAAKAQGKTEDSKKYEAQAAQARAETMEHYRTAVALATLGTPTEELNVVRYYLAWLHWSCEEFYEAAVLGEFLARRYPESAGSRKGAKIAMASYVKLWQAADPDDRQFESEHMTGIADYITKRWAGEPEADEAWMMLIRTAVVSGQLDEALGYLEKIPPESDSRGEAEAMTGQALWSAYLDALRLPKENRPGQDELDKMVKRAQQTLEDGVGRLRKPVDQGGEATYTLVVAVLSLAQIYIEMGEPAKAVKWLDDPKIGPLVLVAAKKAVTDRGPLAVETYKAGLRAYVGVQELDKAETVMNALEKLVAEGGDEDAGKKLTQIYIALGQKLEESLGRLRQQKRTDQLKEVSQGFELFLTRISERPEGNTFGSLNWVAETFLGMGAGYDPGGAELTPEAKKYYTKAAETYKNILQRCKAGQLESPAGATDGLKVRLARCLRRLKQCRDAMALLVDVLGRRNMMVDAQVEAAYTYQTWGQEKGKSQYYIYAIRGGRKVTKDGSTVYLVWGWGKTANMVRRSPRHTGIFHEARYNLALCRFNYARTCKGQEKTDALKQAERDIRMVHQQYPKMGGQEWFGKYDVLLKNIQKLRKVKPVGLSEKSSTTKRKKGTRKTTAS